MFLTVEYTSDSYWTSAGSMSAMVSGPPTPSSSLSYSEGTTRVAKGYKRIKWKAYKPTGQTGKQKAQYSKGVHKWRVNGEDASSATGETPRSQSTDDEIVRTSVRTKFSYDCPSPLQHLPLNGHRQDPFVTLPVEATPDVTSALDFFLATCVPENTNSTWLMGKPNPHMSLLFPFMLKNAMLFDIIVALCRASILMAQGKNTYQDRAFLYRRAKAMKQITANLSSPAGVSDASLLSITMVLTLEYLIGNTHAVITHLGGLQRIMDMRTDLDESTPWKRFVKAGVTAYRSLGTFVMGEPVDMPGHSPGFLKEAFHELALDQAPAYTDLPFSPNLCLELSRLPIGFGELCLSGNVSKQMMNLLAFSQATTAYAEASTELDERLDHEIQIMLAALQRLSITDLRLTERFLCCGLLAYAFQLRSPKSLNIFHDPPLRTFVNALGSHERPDSKRTQDTMIWISVAVAGALSLRSIKMPGSECVMDRMFKLYPSSLKWSYVQNVLRSHFCTTKLMQQWEKCYTSALERWEVVSKRIDKTDTNLLYPTSCEDFTLPDDLELARTSVSFEDITAHTRGAPYSIARMMEATRRCPFQNRLGPSMAGAEGGSCPFSGISAGGE